MIDPLLHSSLEQVLDPGGDAGNTLSETRHNARSVERLERLTSSE